MTMMHPGIKEVFVHGQRQPFTQRLGAFSASRPGLVLGIWLVLSLLAAIYATTHLFGHLSPTFALRGNYDSVIAKTVLRDANLDPVADTRETILLQGHNGIRVDDAAFRETEGQIADRLRAILGEALSAKHSETVTITPLTLDDLKDESLPTPSVVARGEIQDLIDAERERIEAELTEKGEALNARATDLAQRQAELMAQQGGLGQQIAQGQLTPEAITQAQADLHTQGAAIAADGEKIQADQAALEAEIADRRAQGEADEAKAQEILDALVGADGEDAIIIVNAGQPFADLDINAWVDQVGALSTDQVTVTSLGQSSIQTAFTHIVEADLAHAERVGVPVTFLVLVIVFGAIIAALNSLLLAVVSVTGALGLTAVVGQFFSLQLFVVNMVSMLGLAVGVDYCLFVTERYREERRRGAQIQAAIITAARTSGMAMAFSGATVILSLLGIMFVPLNVYQSMSVGAVLVVLVAVMAVLTLLPAVLALLGDRVNWPRRQTPKPYHPQDEGWLYGGFFGKLTKVSVTYPWIVLVASVGLLLGLASPALQLQTGFVGADSLPRGPVSAATHRLYDQWGEGQLFPVEIIGQTKGHRALLESLETSLAEDPFVTRIAPIEYSDINDVARMDIYVAESPSAPQTYAWIRDLRAQLDRQEPVDRLLVGGQSAAELDMQTMLEPVTPLAIGFVLALSFILLLVAFRSIVVPIKAMIYNLLSVGATYGVMTMVFTHGIGIDLFGYTLTPRVEAWLPILLFCVLFGLSMDYHVFILSRIKEHYDLTGNNKESVAVGIRSTARIITGAALIMVVVFLTFSFGAAVQIQQLGFGLAVAVLLDATIIRSLLVPSLMVLMNQANWWLPAWLQWIPAIHIEGSPVTDTPTIAGADQDQRDANHTADR